MEQPYNDSNPPNNISLAEQLKNTADLNAFYEGLAFELNDGDKGRFLSGWQCVNPFAAELFHAVKERAKTIDYGKYVYFDDELDLSNKITKMHNDFDGIAPEFVFCGQGSTSLLFGIAAFLKKKDVKKVYFIPPLYFTLHIALDRFGIQTVQVSTNQPFESNFKIDLPLEQNSVLILTDPIWYVGYSFADKIIDEIIAWQEKTSSYVIVDGSFQYTSWDNSIKEATARLNPSLTFRLICPSKQLAAHGYRFSYVLMPEAEKQNFAWTYTNMNGPANADSIAFAYEAIAAMSDRGITNNLMRLVSQRHKFLRNQKIIESVLHPSCGYFVFEKLNLPLPEGYIKVDGKFFDQKNFPDYTKINLLSPSVNLIGL